MSRYWSKMEILKNSKKYIDEKGEKDGKDNLFISQNRPVFFANKEHYNLLTSSKHDYTDLELDEISDFYCTNFRIEKSNNTFKISKKDLQSYLNVLSELLIIKNQGKLFGSIISLHIPIMINTTLNKEVSTKYSDRFEYFKSENSFVFGCASFLILDQEHRGKGYGMALIQESLQIMYDNGGLAAYFINSTSRCENSIPLYSWYYPLNFDKLDKCKFFYPRDYKSRFLNNLSKFENPEHRIVKVENENIKTAYTFYMSTIKDKIFYFTPSYQYWERWISSFPTYLLYHCEKIVGMFSYNSYNVHFPSNKVELSKGNILICVGKQPETLQASLVKAKFSYDMLTFYEVGDLSKNLLNDIFAQKHGKSYINFFNTRLKINSLDFYCPLF